MSSFTFSGKNILIIEDQRSFLGLLKGLMTGLGSTHVTTCLNAEQAISQCKNNYFDIVISDLHLGANRKNGFELVEELRINKWLKPQSVFLLISADSARPIVMGSVERRADDYLMKPFSQAQLKTRITRAWNKRQFLSPIYVASDQGQFKKAIDIAKDLMSQPSPYSRSCLHILIELYWRTEQFEEALEQLNNDDREKTSLWSNIAKGKTQIFLEEYEDAHDTAVKILGQNQFSVEAHDILAAAQSALDKPEQALQTIQDALKISPFSIQRQFTACRIARESGDYKLASDTCLSIWEQSKRSVHQSTAHWCSYVRSLLDAAQHAEEKQVKNRFQQEALLALQRGYHDDVLSRISHNFDIKLFEELVHARVNTLDGNLIEAKKLLANLQEEIERRYPSFPAEYLPDTVQNLLQIGEFELGHAILTKMEQENIDLDPNSQHTIDKVKKEVKDKQGSYTELNKQGINLYQQGKFAEAKEIFRAAQKIAPVNTGVALNLLQCLLKLINQNANKKPDPEQIMECRQVYKLIEGIPLMGQHLEKFDSLSEELNPILS